MKKYCSLDLFSGCGGLSEGMKQAEFDVKFAIEIDRDAIATYKMNHPMTEVIPKDIREVDIKWFKNSMGDNTLHLLAGCPPCQGFSSIRRLNRNRSVRDPRNRLILNYLEFIEGLNPLTIMLENVPGLSEYYLFNKVVRKLKRIGYCIKFDIVNVKDYGIPQNRERLIMVGSLLGDIDIVKPNNEKMTVRDAIGNLEIITNTNDPLHKITAKHTEKVREMISKIPKNGGSRKDLPKKYLLKCHLKENVGFDDVYGRLRWDDCSGTITGGCLNPSKGRFLHPEENRVISPREAALLQTFPSYYKFPLNISKTSLGNLIGEALPPKFSFIQCRNIKNHIDKYYGG